MTWYPRRTINVMASFPFISDRSMALKVLVVLLSGMYAAVAADPVFHVSFDDGAVPDRAGGSTQTLTDGAVHSVDTPRGRGLSVGPGGRCVYLCRGNILPEEGTLLFWWAPTRDLAFRRHPDDDRNLVRIPSNRHTTIGLVLYIDNGTHLRFALGDGGKRQARASATKPVDWKAGEWHHLAGTWTRNGVRLYIDGEEVGEATKDFVPSFGPFLDVGARVIDHKQRMY